MLYKDKVFSEQEIKGKDFEKATFIHCKLQNLNFHFVTFNGCEFRFCDFSGSSFDIASFINCKFPETKLSNLEFSGAVIKLCDFSDAVMENCVFQKLKGASKSDKKKFDLTDCKFKNSQLQRSIFMFCNLQKVNFANANLENAVFDKCDLKETNFVGSDISAANFESSLIGKTRLDVNGFIAFGNSKGFILDVVS